MNSSTQRHDRLEVGVRETTPRKARILLAVTADMSLILLRGLPAFLVSRGWDVHVVASPGPRLDELRGMPGVSVHAIPMEREPSPVRDSRALLGWILQVRAIRPDLIWAGTPKAGLLAAISGWILRVPERVYILRGLRLETADGLLRRVLTTLEKLTLILSTRALCVSPSLRSEVIRLGLAAPAKLAVLGLGSSNGVDTRRFRPDVDGNATEALRQRIGLLPETPVIGFVGRLSPDKGLGLLQAALRRLVDQGVKFQVLVVGGADGGDLVDELQLDERQISVTGHVHDTSLYYPLIDVLCLPTRREGFPNVVLEAGACAVPTVTTNATGAVDSVVDGVTGRVVEKESAEELANALAEVIQDENLRTSYGERARNWVVKNFAQEAVWERLDAYLNAAVSERVGRTAFRPNKGKAR